MLKVLCYNVYEEERNYSLNVDLRISFSKICSFKFYAKYCLYYYEKLWNNHCRLCAFGNDLEFVHIFRKR